jgi:hypothetical protein
MEKWKSKNRDFHFPTRSIPRFSNVKKGGLAAGRFAPAARLILRENQMPISGSFLDENMLSSARAQGARVLSAAVPRTTAVAEILEEDGHDHEHVVVQSQCGALRRTAGLTTASLRKGMAEDHAHRPEATCVWQWQRCP